MQPVERLSGHLHLEVMRYGWRGRVEEAGWLAQWEKARGRHARFGSMLGPEPSPPVSRGCSSELGCI